MFTIYCLNDLYWFVFVLSDPNIMTPNWWKSARINDIKDTWYWYKILLNVLYQFLFWQKNKCRFFWDNSNNFRSAIKSTDITFFNLHHVFAKSGLTGGSFFRAPFVPTISQIARLGISHATFFIDIKCAFMFVIDKVDSYRDRVQPSNSRFHLVI